MNQIVKKHQYEEKALATLSKSERSLLESTLELKIRDVINSPDTFEVKAKWSEDREEYSRTLNSTQYTQYKIGVMLESGYSLIGIPYENYPPEDIAFVLAHNIVNEYGYFSFQDIVRAFNACCNDLTTVNFHPFKQPVGWLYIRSVLTAYSRYNTEKINKVTLKLESVDTRSKYEVRTELINNRKQNDAAIKHAWIDLYKWTFNNAPIPFYYIQESHYYYLKELNLLDEIEKDKNAIEEQSKIRTTTEKRKNKSSKISALTKDFSSVNENQRAYKKICVELWLKSIRDKNMTIDQFKETLKGICYISRESTIQLIENQKNGRD